MFVLVIWAVVTGGPAAAISLGGQLPRITEFPLGSAPTCCSGGNYLTDGPGGVIWVALSSGVVGRVTFDGGATTWPLGFQPNAITSGPDGNLWVTGPGVIARVTSAGALTRFSAGLTPNSDPFGITTGPNGMLWFTEEMDPPGFSRYPAFENYSRNGIGYISPATGAITELPAVRGAEGFQTIVRSATGDLWFLAAGSVGSVDKTGATRLFRLAPVAAPFGELTAGPQDAVWLTDDAIIRIDAHGRTKRFRLPLPSYTAVAGITAGPDGALWIAEQNRARIGRMTPSGRFTEFGKGMRPGISASEITRGSRRTLWFIAENDQTGKLWIGRIRPYRECRLRGFSVGCND